MKAILKNNASVRFDSAEKPKIDADDRVLIHIAAAGLCRTDVYVAEGKISAKDKIILGHEFSGIVEKAGDGVSHVTPGDRVAVMPLFPKSDRRLSNGLPSYADATMLGIHHDGAFAEYVSVPASAVYKLPDNVSFLQGAYMEPIAASMAVLNADIRPGQRGLIYGDNRISRLTERIMRAKGFNDLSVCAHGDGGLIDDSYDFIIETLATTPALEDIVRAVKPGGTIVLKSRQHTPVAMNINSLVMKDVRIDCVSYGDFGAGIDLVSSNALKADDLFGDVYPLEKYADVFEMSKNSESLKLFFSSQGRDVWDR